MVHSGDKNYFQFCQLELSLLFFDDIPRREIVNKAVANGGPKRKPSSVLVSVTLKNDAIGSEKPNANALSLGDSVPISQ